MWCLCAKHISQHVLFLIIYIKLNMYYTRHTIYIYTRKTYQRKKVLSLYIKWHFTFSSHSASFTLPWDHVLRSCLMIIFHVSNLPSGHSIIRYMASISWLCRQFRKSLHVPEISFFTFTFSLFHPYRCDN